MPDPDNPVGLGLTFADLAYLRDLGAVEIEVGPDGGLRSVSFPRHRRRRRGRDLRTVGPAPPEPSQEPPMVPQEAECACCGQTMMRVVVIDGALTASVLAEPVAAEPFLVPQADGIYEERRQAWRLHAPHCPKWEGDTDWRSSAARIPIM